MKKIVIFFLAVFLYGSTYTNAVKYYKNKQYKKAFGLFQDLAYDGNPNAQFNLGFMYYKGLGVKPNKQLAFIWFERDQNKKINMHKICWATCMKMMK